MGRTRTSGQIAPTEAAPTYAKVETLLKGLKHLGEMSDECERAEKLEKEARRKYREALAYRKECNVKLRRAIKEESEPNLFSNGTK